MRRRKACQGWRIAIAVLGISLWALCNAEAQKGCTKSLIIENDFLVPTDRYYTAGFALTRFCDANNAVKLSVKDWFKPGNFLGESFYGGLTLYTPNDLGKNEPMEGDGRPYGSSVLLGGNVFLRYAPNTVIKHDLHLAVLGLDWGGKLQRWWHDVIGSSEPKGWSSQISDGGEPSFMYSVEGRRLFSGKNNGHFNLSGNLGASIGYYATVHGGLSATIGNIPPFWSDYGPASRHSMAILLRPNDPTAPKTRVEFYAFLMGGAHYVIYNALLQGQFRDSGYEISDSDMSRMVLHSSVGAVAGLRFSGGRGFHFSFSYSWKGEEIKGGENHLWNSISFGFSY